MSEDLDAILRDAWIRPDEVPLADIRAASATKADALDEDGVGRIVRCAFGEMTADATDEILEAFNSDAEVVGRDDLYRQQLLAVAILVALLADASGAHVDKAALAIRSLLFSGREPAHPALLSASDGHIRWARKRAATPASRPRAVSQTGATKTALDQLSTADWGLYRAAILAVSNEVARVRQALARYVAWVEQRDAPVYEQLELLWWVSSGISTSTDYALADLPPEAAPIVAALDIASLAPRTPGPPSSLGLLRFALSQADVDADQLLELETSRAALLGLEPRGVPTPPTADSDFFPVFAYVGQAAPAPAPLRTHATALELGVQALQETYLHTLSSQPEDS